MKNLIFLDKMTQDYLKNKIPTYLKFRLIKILLFLKIKISWSRHISKITKFNREAQFQYRIQILHKVKFKNYNNLKQKI